MQYPDYRVALHRGIKCLLFGLGLAVLGVTAVLMLRGIFFRQMVTQQTPVYHYTYQPTLRSEMRLKPNHIYAESTLEGDFLCPQTLADTLLLHVSAAFEGEEKALLSMEYTVDSEVVGEMEAGVLWRHSVPLRESQKIENYAQVLSLSETLSVSIAPYEAFARQAIAETGVTPQHIFLRVVLRGTLTADTAYGVLKKPMVIQASMPLLQPTYTMETDVPAAETAQLETVVTQRAPLSKPLLCGCGCVLCIGVGFLVFLQCGTRTYTRNDRLNRRVRLILRQYRHRIVALRDASDLQEFYTRYEVSDMADLIKISREMERPVFYLLPTDHMQNVRDNCFYVQTEAARFLYRIE